MKKLSNLISLNLFIIWVLVTLLAGIGSSIYANEDTEKEAKKDDKKITRTLEAGEVGKGYCRKLTAPKKIKIAKWILKEGSSLPNGLQLAETGYLFGIPTEQKKFTFDLQGFDENSNPVIDKDSNKPITYKMSLNIKPKINFSQLENLRIITGYEISRASSTTGSEKAFFDVYLSQPLPFFRIKKGKLIVWGNIRFTSTPRQNDKAIGAVSTDYFSTLSDLKLNEMTQSVEFLGGIEYNLFSIKKSKEGEYNYTLGLTVAYGGSTPMVSETTPKLVVFNMPISDQLKQELKTRYSNYNFEGKEFISFVPEDRESFFHQYYFGFRLKAYTNENGNSKLPVTIDISYGMNQAASGGIGRLFTKKSVLRFDGFLPIEILHIPIYLFGTVCINVAKDDTVHTPLILGELVTDDNTQSINSDKLLIVTEKPNKRDFFKIGIGIDLYKIFKTSQDNKNEEVTKAKGTRKVLEELLDVEKKNNSKMKDVIKEALIEMDPTERVGQSSDADAKKSLIKKLRETVTEVQDETKTAEEKARKKLEE